LQEAKKENGNAEYCVQNRWSLNRFSNGPLG
jgi:hypothetical protein